ncbi:hypothetical protein [Rhizobium halophytocola]|uniref:Uncharacterized protein n=1 Tax=Rhizobium halophytocola TaxID=735519 RepID=A0ABS4DZY9_9HYPH|nr:hypothetical protein [Rhizobium halophytocola]MBP1851260.1 hypothetical protein [Rhizobium halophytocola]
MIFVTAMTIGIAASLMRSVTAIAVAAFLIVATFALAALISPAMPPILSLVLAIAGYNAGLIECVALGLLLLRRRQNDAS